MTWQSAPVAAVLKRQRGIPQSSAARRWRPTTQERADAVNAAFSEYGVCGREGVLLEPVVAYVVSANLTVARVQLCKVFTQKAPGGHEPVQRACWWLWD
jgi:hypothetical protein